MSSWDKITLSPSIITSVNHTSFSSINSIDSLALCTISSGATFKSIPNGKYVDVVTGDIKNVTNNTLTTGNISKGGLRVYVLENSTTGTLSKIGNTTTYLK